MKKHMIQPVVILSLLAFVLMAGLTGKVVRYGHDEIVTDPLPRIESFLKARGYMYVGKRSLTAGGSFPLVSFDCADYRGRLHIVPVGEGAEIITLLKRLSGNGVRDSYFVAAGRVRQELPGWFETVCETISNIGGDNRPAMPALAVIEQGECPSARVLDWSDM